MTAERHTCHAGSSSANTNITATTSQPRPRRRQSAPQLRQEALCTAPATQRADPRPLRRQSAPQLLPEALSTAPATQRAAAATPATIRAAAPSGGSVYCACHTQSSRGHSGLPHEEQPRPLRRQSAPQLLQEAMCTAPATQRAAAATPATIRAAAPSGGSVYCACHTKSSRGHCGDNPRRSSFRGSVYCACHTKSSRGHCGDNPRRSSFRRLCVLRLPHKEQPRPLRRQSAPQLRQEALCTAPATQRAAAATPATIRAAAPSGGSVYCACHTKSSRGHCGDNPRRSSFKRLCVLRLPHKEQPRPLRRQSAPHLRQKALCTAPAKQHVCEVRCVR